MTSEVKTETLFLELGKALYVFQAIEARLKMVLPHLVVRGRDEPPEDEGWNGRRKYLDSKEMLGTLIKLFQQRLSVDQPARIEAEWREVIQGRNDVVHNFVLQPFASCTTAEDLKKSLEYVRIRRLRALPLLQMLDFLAQGFLAVLQLPPGYEGEVPIQLPEWWAPSAA